MLESWKLAPALASGCTVVLKPAEFTPLSASLLGRDLRGRRAARRACSTSSTASARRPATRSSKHPDVPLISFTGESSTGALIFGNCGRRCSRASRWSSAASPPPSCSPTPTSTPRSTRRCSASSRSTASAAPRAAASSSSARSTTSSATRYAARAEKIVVGDPHDPATEVGALVHPEHFDKVMSYVELGKSEGRLLAGGGRPEGLPTGNYVAADRVRRRRSRRAHLPGGDLRSGRRDHPVRHRRRGARARQRREVRPRRLHLDERPQARPHLRPAGRGRHGLAQLAQRARPAHAVRRGQGLRPRPRGRLPLDRLLHRRAGRAHHPRRRAHHPLRSADRDDADSALTRHPARHPALRLPRARRHRPRRVARVLRRHPRAHRDLRGRDLDLPAPARGVHPPQPRAAHGPGRRGRGSRLPRPHARGRRPRRGVLPGARMPHRAPVGRIRPRHRRRGARHRPARLPRTSSSTRSSTSSASPGATSCTRPAPSCASTTSTRSRPTWRGASSTSRASASGSPKTSRTRMAWSTPPGCAARTPCTTPRSPAERARACITSPSPPTRSTTSSPSATSSAPCDAATRSSAAPAGTASRTRSTSTSATPTATGSRSTRRTTTPATPTTRSSPGTCTTTSAATGGATRSCRAGTPTRASCSTSTANRSAVVEREEPSELAVTIGADGFSYTRKDDTEAGFKLGHQL